MDNITDIATYLRAWSSELGDRILQTYPPLHSFGDAASPLIAQLLRKPYPAQTLAMMGVVKRWHGARGAAVIAECGTGKTLISLGAVHAHSHGKPFTALAMNLRGRRYQAVRKAHAPRQGRRNAVVTISGYQTTNSSNGVCNGSGRGGQIEHSQNSGTRPETKEHQDRDTRSKPTEPSKRRSAENNRKRILEKSDWMFEDMPQLRASNPKK